MKGSDILKAEFIIEGIVHNISDVLIIKVPQASTDYFFEVHALELDKKNLRKRDLVRIEGTLYNTTIIYPDLYGNNPPVYKYYAYLYANKIIQITGGKRNGGKRNGPNESI